MVILVLFAFLAGVVTVLSPCILPLLPIILSSSIGGRSRSVGVIVGFIASFTFFTLFLALIVNFTGISASTLRSISIVILFFFGLTLILPQLQLVMEKVFVSFSRFAPKNYNHNGLGGGFLVGVSLGLLWTPCVGPILASVITLALSGNVTFHTFLITLSYSIGTAIPMFLVMQAGNTALQRVPWLTRNTPAIQRIFGFIMILTAVGIYFQIERRFQSYILDRFPQYGSILTNLENNPMVLEKLQK